MFTDVVKKYNFDLRFKVKMCPLSFFFFFAYNFLDVLFQMCPLFVCLLMVFFLFTLGTLQNIILSVKNMI